MIRVGDKLKIELELRCIRSPADSKGSLVFRIADSMATLKSEDEEFGSVGGAMGGNMYIDVKLPGEDRGIALLGGAAVQWNAVAKALKEQYGVEVVKVEEEEK